MKEEKKVVEKPQKEEIIYHVSPADEPKPKLKAVEEGEIIYHVSK